MVTEQHIWEFLADVQDPEIPVISVLDLGVVRKVDLIDQQSVDVTVTPTYSGCPAMSAISIGIRMKLLSKGFKKINVIHQLSPAWSTDWMSESGKKRLQEYGIAPPQPQSHDGDLFSEDVHIECPRCHSVDTKLISQFGSTACKALYQCESCHEPFDYFKCHH